MLSKGGILLFIEIKVTALYCGVEITFSLPLASSACTSLACRSITRSASPRSTRLARVAGSGTVWMIRRLKKAGLSGEPRFHASLRFAVACSPGLKVSTI
jgi:hypothetical protein